MLHHFRVRIYPSHRAIKPLTTTLIAARNRGEAHRMAREASSALGCTFYTLED